jgi:hypothetical protein
MEKERMVESLLASARRAREEAEELAVTRGTGASTEAERRRRAAAYAEESAARIARAA